MEQILETILETAKKALKEEPDNYCIQKIDEYGNHHDILAWQNIKKVYGCVIESGFRTSRRLLIVSGAVIVHVVDGAETFCYVTNDISNLLTAKYSEAHIFENPYDVDYAKFICMR
jgi:hypothetical protein